MSGEGDKDYATRTDLYRLKDEIKVDIQSVKGDVKDLMSVHVGVLTEKVEGVKKDVKAITDAAINAFARYAGIGVFLVVLAGVVLWSQRETILSAPAVVPIVPSVHGAPQHR